MLKLSLFVRLEAKPGKENEVAAFLNQGLELAKQEANIVIDYVTHPEATDALEKLSALHSPRIHFA